MSDDARSWNALCISFLINNCYATRVIDMAMGVDNSVNRAVVPAADGRKSLACRPGLRSVDKNEPLRRPNYRYATAKIRRVDCNYVFGNRRECTIRN